MRLVGVGSIALLALTVAMTACQGDGTEQVNPSANDRWFDCGPAEPCGCLSDDDCESGRCDANVCVVTCGDGLCDLGEHCNLDCDTSPTCGNGICSAGEVCPIDCNGPPVCGDGLCAAGESCPLDCQNTCPTLLAGITPQQTEFGCGTPDLNVVGIFNDINMFWQSSIVPCPCVADAFPMCTQNAFAAKLSPGLGFVHYDAAFVAYLQSAGGGSLLGPAWLLAHEVGHNLQAVVGYYPSSTLEAELWSDCIGGFFIGWLSCQGKLNQADIQALLNTICIKDEGPWLNPDGHGPCSKRIEYTMRGANAYLSGFLPAQVCPFSG